MFTQFLKPRAARRKVIVWGLGFAAFVGSFLALNVAAASPACVPTSTSTSGGITTVTFNVIGTCDWVVPAGVTTVDADVVGGGGSGGVGSFGGGGGGGGQVVMLRQMAVTGGATQTITVGAGGAAGVNVTSGAGINGNDGSPSSFLGYSAAGGVAGKKHVTGTSTPGAGGGSYLATTITTSGTVSTTLLAGGAGTTIPPSNCVPGRNGGGGAGLVSIDANSVAAMNAVIAGLSATDVDSTAKLAALLEKIRAAAAATNAQTGVIVDQTPNTISRVLLSTGTNGTLVLKWTGAPTVDIKVVSSSGQTQSYTASQQQAGQIIDSLEPGRAYAIIVSPVGNTDPNAAQSVAYAVPALTPVAADVTQVALNKVQLTWSQQGFAKFYKIVVTPNKGAVQTLTTGETKLDLTVIGGRKYEVTVTSVGEGDGASQPAIIDINPAGAVTSVVATPFAKKKQTLVSWKPFEVRAKAKYVVRVDGKQVCAGSLTSCVVPRVLTSKNDVVVSVVGGAATAVEIDDRKLVFQAQVGFVPNTAILEPGAAASVKANAANLNKAGFTKVVVTGHANPVDGVPLKISEKLANQRALVIAEQLRKLLPGVRVVAIGRSVLSPAKSGAAQSIGNIRAEIYGTK